MDRKESSPLIEALRREQANAVQLYLQYKGYHWNVFGPSFHDLHLLFDTHATQVFETIDELAERQRILGAPAEYTLEAMRAASNLVAEEKIPATPREMIEHLVASHRRVIGTLKGGFELADRLRDPGTADLFARLVQLHEKAEWFLREILEKAPPVGGK
ncbi:MAG: DNA starvation/stationary phase protection protein [Thermoplasmata archaeon]